MERRLGEGRLATLIRGLRRPKDPPSVDVEVHPIDLPQLTAYPLPAGVPRDALLAELEVAFAAIRHAQDRQMHALYYYLALLAGVTVFATNAAPRWLNVTSGVSEIERYAWLLTAGQVLVATLVLLGTSTYGYLYAAGSLIRARSRVVQRLRDLLLGLHSREWFAVSGLPGDTRYRRRPFSWRARSPVVERVVLAALWLLLTLSGLIACAGVAYLLAGVFDASDWPLWRPLSWLAVFGGIAWHYVASVEPLRQDAMRIALTEGAWQDLEEVAISNALGSGD